MLRINGQKAHLPSRFSEQGYSWSDGWLCPLFVSPRFFLYIFPSVIFQYDNGDEVSSGERGYGSLWCGFPSLSCMIAMLSRQLIPAPFAKAVGSLLSVSELLWALTLFLHYHLGMRQLKASGNLGFIDIAQRPQPGSICFPWQVSTTPACLRGCCPCTQPMGPYSCTSVGETHFFLTAAALQRRWWTWK